MPSTTTSELAGNGSSTKSLRIKQDDKFFSRLLSKDTSQPNSSCRVYYGEAAGAVPFVWESQPGTPKHALFESASLPPLTPPPSYAKSNVVPATKSMHRRPASSSSSTSKTKLLLLSTIFGKDQAKKERLRKLSQPSSLSLSSLSSSSTSSSSSWSNYSASAASSSLNKIKKKPERRRWFSDVSTVGPLDYGAEFDDHDHDHDHAASSFRSPTSTLCFPVMKKKTWDFLAGCYAMGNNMKIGRRVL